MHKITEKENCPFSETDYSKFKFGDTAIAKKFAGELFRGFIAEHAGLILKHEEVIILPSPYLAIPTASNCLSFHFMSFMNRFLFENNKKALKESKIYRNQTYVEDYGSLGYAERVKMISNDTYYIDKNIVDGKLCIFMDDIKITGSHEFIVKKILGDHNVKGHFIFAYFAELANKDIHPDIENHFNYFYINSLSRIISLINQDTFCYNTRMIKYILRLEVNDLILLLQSIPQHRIDALFHLAVSNNYHIIKEYKQNLESINKKTSDYGYKLAERTT
ncbi:MAG TPA: phosphoribosyltransferase family protein [Flavobacterium sp.]|nr:phosphoribosyltransferase family protein [Flavobacterium sp.]